MTIIPKYLYKYRVWEDKHHKKILSDNEIYFSSSAKFNDPFDCKIPLRYDKLTRTLILQYVHKLGRHLSPNVHEETLWKESKKRADNPTIQGKNLLKNASKEQIENIERNYGIFSLTTDPKNIIMWSHYAKSHTGFCVCFDVLKLKQFFSAKEATTKAHIKLHNVRYEDEYPIILPSRENSAENLLQILLTKSKLWSYEDEFRFIINGASGSRINIPNEFIKCVILGCKISDPARNEIIDILKDKKNRITLCQAKMNELDFGLFLEKVNY